MPNITVEIFKGRTLDQRRRLVQGITRAAVDALGIQPEGVRITFFEIERADLARGGVLFSDLDGAQAPAASSSSTTSEAVEPARAATT